MSAETEVIWNNLQTMRENHESLRQEHQDLRVEHTELKGMVRAVLDKIEENRKIRDAQHAEQVRSISTLASTVTSLATEQHERQGMAKLGRAVATVVGAVATLVALYFSFKPGDAP